MTLTTVLIYIAIAALVLTGIIGGVFKKTKNWLLSYLQNFCGALFIFSGWVKAVDPLGTAYKMEQYFAEFTTHMPALTGLWELMGSFTVLFSVVMIILEIVLGIMLIIGDRPKLTAWLFFLIVAFFTALTGFTYLTGHVPGDATFFQFGQWGDWVETNMKVTDCGCFGDFIKLEPFTSFMKDVFLLFPAVLFLFTTKKMHQVFTPTIRNVIVGVSTIGLIFYCLSNYHWDIPGQDFRPFKNGVDIAERKQMEEEAQTNVEITHYEMTNKASGEVVKIPFAQYMKEFKSYPTAEWDLEQIKTDPIIPRTKISDFEFSNLSGEDATEDILGREGYHFLIVSKKMKYDSQKDKYTYQDTTYAIDTVRIDGTDSTTIVKSIADVQTKEATRENIIWDADYQDKFKDIVNPLAAAGEKEGVMTDVIIYGIPDVVEDFRHATQTPYPFYTGDDILLKTIIRSNPGIILMKDGAIVKKWHYKKVPDYATIKAQYMQ